MNTPATLDMKRGEWHARFAKSYELAKQRTAACEVGSHAKCDCLRQVIECDCARRLPQVKCSCVCGGRYHGKPHPPMFVAEYAARLAAQEQEAEEIDLFNQDWGTPCDGEKGGA